MMQKTTRAPLPYLVQAELIVGARGGQGVRMKFDSPALKPSGRSVDWQENKNDSGSLRTFIRDFHLFPA